jgi:hypothetical protein
VLVDEQNQLITLFLSEKNPFWTSILGKAPVGDELERLSGAPYESRRNWKNNKVTPSEKVLKVIVNTTNASIQNSEIDDAQKSKLKTDFSEFLAIYRNEEPDHRLSRCAVIFKYKPEEYRQLFDEIATDKRPLLTHAYYTELRDAKRDFQMLRGLYTVKMSRHGEIYQCPLWVQYVIEIAGVFAIRCHMWIPNNRKISGETDAPWRYNGFVVMRANVGFWVFDKIDENRTDMVFFVTHKTDRGASARRGDLLFRGKYLTSDQTQDQIAVSDPVSIERSRNSDRILQTDHAIDIFVRKTCDFPKELFELTPDE